MPPYAAFHQNLQCFLKHPFGSNQYTKGLVISLYHLQTDEFEPTTKIEPYIKEFRKVVAAEATKTAVAVST